MSRFLSTRFFDSSLEAAWRRALLLLATGLAAAALGGECLRVAVAAKLGESLDLRKLQTALRLDPRNPELHRRLGQAYLFVIEDLDPPEGVKHFRRATELNPRLAPAWADLGSACDLVRDTSCADGAFERALGLNHESAELEWLAGNHYLLTGRNDAALEHFRRLLELGPRYAAPTFALCLRVLKDPELIARRVLPESSKDATLALAFVNFLTFNGKEDHAYRVWSETATRSSRFEFARVKPYLDGLVERGRYEEAASVWRDLERLEVVPRAEGGNGNLIYNGDFEQAPLEAGLDWQARKELYLATDFGDPTAYQGRCSLRLDFTVARNAEHEPVFQIVPVASDQTYALSAYVRSEDISSDSGPRLRVVSLSCSQRLDVSTEMTVGTTAWHRIGTRFTTGAETRFVRLSVWRPRSRSFPTEIRGSFWVDAVRLEALNSETGKP